MVRNFINEKKQLQEALVDPPRALGMTAISGSPLWDCLAWSIKALDKNLVGVWSKKLFFLMWEVNNEC